MVGRRAGVLGAKVNIGGRWEVLYSPRPVGSCEEDISDFLLQSTPDTKIYIVRIKAH